MEINLKTVLVIVAASAGLLSNCTKAMAQDHTQLSLVSQSMMWTRLLHRHEGALTNRSEIDSPDFFLHPNGARDAMGELTATLRAFEQPASFKIGRYEQHPQCAFPARYRYLKSELKLETRDVECPEFRKWKTALAARSVTLVYAAPFLGNPASMFGHTFLRLNSDTLRDAGVSFDAQPSNDGPFVYAWKGTMGGYQGLFSQQPYYAKIKTYGHIESRDLWEFELNLTASQIDRLIDHLWELGAASFDYYFFDENCSYQLLSLLEVANLEWSFRSKFPFWTIPLDTVRVVAAQPSAIRQVRMRPALRTTLENKVAGLSERNRRAYHELIASSGTAKGAALRVKLEQENAEVLDALLDWISTRKVRDSDRVANDFEESVLLARATKATVVSNIDARFNSQIKIEDPSMAPQNGHRSAKVTLAYFGNEKIRGGSLTFRPALHDKLEPDLGYVPFSSLTLGQMEISYLQNRQISLENLTIAAVENLQPMTELRRAPSWVAGFGIMRPTDLDCEDCLMAQLRFGIGVSQSFERNLFALLINGRAEFSRSFGETYGRDLRASPSVEAIAILRIFSDSNLELGAEQMWFLASLERNIVPRFLGRAVWAIPFDRVEIRVQSELASAGGVNPRNSWNSRVAVGLYF